VISLEKILDLLPQTFDQSYLPLAGKQFVRGYDVYPLSATERLLVATDQVSAFGQVLGLAPYKGQALNQLSAWWFAQSIQNFPNHFLALPDPNAMLTVRTTPLPVEVNIIGYLGSAALWQRYSQGERLMCGNRLPDGLHKNQVLAEPLLIALSHSTPDSHGEHLSSAEVVKKNYLDANTWEILQTTAMACFRDGQLKCNQAGLILVEAHYAFGYSSDGRLLLINAIHTPDSAHFWLASSYVQRIEQNLEPEEFDKQILRLAYEQKGYRGKGEPPAMSANLWAAVSQRYIALHERLSGHEFIPGEYPVQPRLIDNLRKAGLL
jgi:phosphoribosylaminoimidazole-succinocarboxamide synthase